MSNIYYKVLNKDMNSPYQHFHYELNKTYSTDKKLEPCESGFHACKNMYEMLLFINNKLEECRFFKCTLGDKVVECDHRVLSNSITLTEEIPFEVVDKDIRDHLDILVHDGNFYLRAAAARYGYGLDTLINDKNAYVRADVANHGYGLDVLINDESFFVRRAVASRGYGLDILINDKDGDVRAEVAKQGYGLDILVNDESEYVRRAVAEQIWFR